MITYTPKEHDTEKKKWKYIKTHIILKLYLNSVDNIYFSSQAMIYMRDAEKLSARSTSPKSDQMT